jgi:hypothetical protein
MVNCYSVVVMEEILDGDNLLAVIIRSNYRMEGILFATPNEFSQQLGYMNRPMGYEIKPHRHLFNRRTVEYTQETLFIRSGKIRVDFFTDDQVYIKSTILSGGDVVLLANGGHGFEMLEQSEIIEVKQGPYDSDKDKIRFNSLDKSKIRF